MCRVIWSSECYSSDTTGVCPPIFHPIPPTLHQAWKQPHFRPLTWLGSASVRCLQMFHPGMQPSRPLRHVQWWFNSSGGISHWWCFKISQQLMTETERTSGSKPVPTPVIHHTHATGRLPSRRSHQRLFTGWHWRRLSLPGRGEQISTGMELSNAGMIPACLHLLTQYRLTSPILTYVIGFIRLSLLCS